MLPSVVRRPLSFLLSPTIHYHTRQRSGGNLLHANLILLKKYPIPNRTRFWKQIQGASCVILIASSQQTCNCTRPSSNQPSVRQNPVHFMFIGQNPSDDGILASDFIFRQRSCGVPTHLLSSASPLWSLAVIHIWYQSWERRRPIAVVDWDWPPAPGLTAQLHDRADIWHR